MTDKLDEAVAYVEDAVEHTKLDPLTLDEVTRLETAARRLAAAVDACIARTGLQEPNGSRHR